jgi:hypothetical protein
MNYKLTKNELKLNYKLGISSLQVMHEHSNEWTPGIGIHDRNTSIFNFVHFNLTNCIHMFSFKILSLHQYVVFTTTYMTTITIVKEIYNYHDYRGNEFIAKAT